MILNENLNFQEIFRQVPLAMIIARDRIMIECNDAALEMFRAARPDIVPKLFSVLYPGVDEFEAAGRRMEPFLAGRVAQDDNRIMRRIDGSHFWVRVRGHAFNRATPHALTAWLFSEVHDTGEGDPKNVGLTPREREIAALLLDRLTSKQIAKALDISPKTVDIHRASLLKKYAVRSTAELIEKLRA
ncbi:PAS and helix-turn-helix domain-containing protein [Paracoccus sp. (in: a-proteobacteria)]|uniref:PAS and helix-turn-helix domain-containing protein n=1 Tax=Paracoccus sp. TaxID=267 RepID=UPI0028AAFF6F|nr:PAS and helix-turn-helix domain-containing protein [Paracoccus sp. (in: a-proteobacteria)]